MRSTRKTPRLSGRKAKKWSENRSDSLDERPRKIFSTLDRSVRKIFLKYSRTVLRLLRLLRRISNNKLRVFNGQRDCACTIFCSPHEDGCHPPQRLQI